MEWSHLPPATQGGGHVQPGLKGGLTPAMIDITWIIRKSVDGEPQREWSSFHSRCTVGTFFLSDRASECPPVTGTVSAATGSKIQRQQTKDHFPGPVFCEGSWPPISPCRGRGPLRHSSLSGTLSAGAGRGHWNLASGCWAPSRVSLVSHY